MSFVFRCSMMNVSEFLIENFRCYDTTRTGRNPDRHNPDKHNPDMDITRTGHNLDRT